MEEVSQDRMWLIVKQVIQSALKDCSEKISTLAKSVESVMALSGEGQSAGGRSVGGAGRS